jgi:nitroreductase
MIEVGHVGENVFLQAGALGLAAGIVGAFDDARLAKALHLPRAHEPLLVMPVGHEMKRR